MNIVIEGSRGKSGVVKTLVDLIRYRGKSVLGKITGLETALFYNGEKRLIERKNKKFFIDLENRRILREYQGVEFKIFENQGLSRYTMKAFHLIFKPEIVVIPNIRYEHQNSLGDSIEDIQKLYIFFLMCSCNTKVVRDGNILESDFEHISTLVLKAFLPSHAQVYHFGKSSYADDRYTGHLTNKLDQLASDVKCQTAYVEEDFADQDTGDGGLDVVAWVPFPGDNDNFMNIQVYLGQCAIGKDWVGKQTDVEKMKNNIHFPLGTVSVMFVPHDLRKENNLFKGNRICTHIMFDRFRLMGLVDTETLTEMRGFNTFTQVISRLNFDNVDITEI